MHRTIYIDDLPREPRSVVPPHAVLAAFRASLLVDLRALGGIASSAQIARRLATTRAKVEGNFRIMDDVERASGGLWRFRDAGSLPAAGR